jgi:hypothetical protein
MIYHVLYWRTLNPKDMKFDLGDQCLTVICGAVTILVLTTEHYNPWQGRQDFVVRTSV